MLQRLSVSFDEEIEFYPPRRELEAMDQKFTAAMERAFELGLESRASASAIVKMNGKLRADEIAIELAWRWLRENMEAGIDVTFLEVVARCPGVDPHKVHAGIKRRLMEVVRAGWLGSNPRRMDCPRIGQ